MNARSNSAVGSTLGWVIACVLTIGLLVALRRDDPVAVEPAQASKEVTTNAASATGTNDAEPLFMRQRGAAVYPLVQNHATPATVEEKTQWVGAAVCAECHESKYRSAVHTSHYKTSSFPNATNLLGAFDGPHSWMATANPAVKYRMFREGDRYYQAVHSGGEENFRASIDLIIGSGKMAQTFGTWMKDDLYELPLTSLQPDGRWVNSPGYPDGVALYNRPINTGCLKCHATGFVTEGEGDFSNRYKSRHVVAGITCERCHGQGGKHVAFHRANPDEKFAKHIIDPRKLTLTESHELCSQCHGGLTGIDAEMHKPGVHSNNQLPRMKKSKCYTASGGMNCVICHNPHRLERGNNRLFAQRCQTCHKVEDCGAVTPERRKHFSENCAECHMKKQTITDISFETKEGKVEVEMVDHFIRVFGEGEQ